MDGHTPARMCTHTHTHTHTYTYTCAHTHTYTLTCARAHTHACAHAHSLTHTHTHTHTHTLKLHKTKLMINNDHLYWKNGKVPGDVMKACRGCGGKTSLILTLALDKQEWSATHHRKIAPRTHEKGCWVGLTAGLDVLEKKISLSHQEWNHNSSAVQPIA